MATAVPRQTGAGAASPFMSAAMGFLLAMGTSAAALGLTLTIRHLTGSPTFFAFYVAIFVSMWFGGRAAGWLSAVAAGLIFQSLFHGLSNWSGVTQAEIPTLLALFVSAATADVLSTRRHRTENALRAARDRLEIAVRERTTELRETNKALRASELRWRKMYEASSAGIARVDLDGRFIGANAAFRDMVGYTEDELRTFTTVELTHEDDRAATVNALAEFKTTARLEYHVEKRYVRKDGTPVWVAINTTFVPGSDGSPAHLQAILIDITERKRADVALRAGEERWRRLFEASSAGMSLADLTSRYLATNAAFQNMLGYSDEELKALSAIEITHPDERGATRDVVAGFVSGTRQEYHADKRYMRKDGTPLWASVTTTYVPPTDTTPPMLQNIYINIDDRKRTEQALRASEERWRSLFETSSVGIATSNTERRIATANAAFERMVGYTEAELRALEWVALTHEDDRSATDELVAGLVSGRRQGYQIEKRYRRKDGETIWVNVNASFVPATETTPAFFPAIIVDITGRRRAEEALQRSQAELARVSRVTTMGQLTASIAHEINQPLAAIVASGSACRRWLANGKNLTRAGQSLDRMIDEANRASEVIRRIRSLTTNAAPAHAALDINLVAQEVLAIARAELLAKQVLVQAKLAPYLPPANGDRVQLQQVLLNLIVNAIDAMATIADRARVLAVVTQRDGEGIRVTVQDSGCGLAPESAEHIFHPFFTTKPGGMGMGLSISASIIVAHGGRLWAEPALPSGTAFHFTLPAG